MGNSWTNDVDEGDEDAESVDSGGFESKLQAHVDDGTATDIEEIEWASHVHEVEDASLLKQAYVQLEGNGHDEELGLVENRLHDLDAAIPTGETEQSSLDDVEEDEPPTGSSDPAGDPSDDEEAETPIESAKDIAEQEESLGGEVDEDESESPDVDADGEPPQPQSAMSVEEAAERDRRWKVLVWGPPGLFKSHFCYTAPEPVAYIDTEGKAHDIAHKFSEKEVQIWQPDGFREAQTCLSEALEWLDWWRENEDLVGTIVIDSMSLIWEWAKTAYKTEAYPMTDNEEVTLSSNMGTSQDSDWAHIKGMHNSEFREWMTDSPYHFIWTAMETEDYGAVMEGDGGGKTPMKPEGEKNNVFKADSILRARKDDDGNKVGDLTKSNFTDHLFAGLERPTFPKLQNVIETLESAEASPDAVKKGKLEKELGVTIVKGNPTND